MIVLWYKFKDHPRETAKCHRFATQTDRIREKWQFQDGEEGEEEK